MPRFKKGDRVFITNYQAADEAGGEFRRAFEEKEPILVNGYYEESEYPFSCETADGRDTSSFTEDELIPADNPSEAFINSLYKEESQ